MYRQLLVGIQDSADAEGWIFVNWEVHHLLVSLGILEPIFYFEQWRFRIIAIVRYGEKNEDDQAQHTGY